MPMPLEEAAELLASKGLTIAVAESSAGGYLSHLLTTVPGVSKSFLGGVVAYGNLAKVTILKVPEDLLKHEGAVSAQTALSMAAGVRVLLNADIGVSETGIAGPGGGDSAALGAFAKPVGIVFIAIVARDGYQMAERCLWKTDRAGFKDQTAAAMLDLALHYLRRGRSVFTPAPKGSLTTEDTEDMEQSRER